MLTFFVLYVILSFLYPRNCTCYSVGFGTIEPSPLVTLISRNRLRFFSHDLLSSFTRPFLAFFPFFFSVSFMVFFFEKKKNPCNSSAIGFHSFALGTCGVKPSLRLLGRFSRASLATATNETLERTTTHPAAWHRLRLLLDRSIYECDRKFLFS